MNRNPFLLIFRDSPDVYQTMSPEQRQNLLNDWNAWYDNLAVQGKVQHGHPLEPEGRVITARGETVIDGPYAESKEAVGGYFLLTVEDLEEATEIARDCPGLPHGITVEVRAIAETCPILRSVSGEQRAAMSTT